MGELGLVSGLHVQQQLRQEFSLHQYSLLSRIFEMTSFQLFEYLKEHEGKGKTGAYPMFSLKDVMTVPRHLDVQVIHDIIYEASANYIEYPSGNNGNGGRKLFGLLGWMLQMRERMLKTATTFILRYQHNFFWGGRAEPEERKDEKENFDSVLPQEADEDFNKRKCLIPISVQGAVDYINGHLTDFLLDRSINYSLFYRVIRNKIVSVEGKEYPMSFFFTAKKIHPHDVDLLIKKELKKCPRLSDAQLSGIFFKEFGIYLARRTVTKYRSELGVPRSNKKITDKK